MSHATIRPVAGHFVIVFADGSAYREGFPSRSAAQNFAALIGVPVIP